MSNGIKCFICHQDIKHKQRVLHLYQGVARWVCAGDCYKQIHEAWRKEQANDKGKRGYRA